MYIYIYVHSTIFTPYWTGGSRWLILDKQKLFVVVPNVHPASHWGPAWQGLIIPQRAGHASVAIFGAVGVLIGRASLSMVALQQMPRCEG